MKAKNNNHHTLFITLIIALFVLLIVALSKARSYGSELGFDENEVSSNDEINEEITESPEKDSEEGTSISFSETDEEFIPINETILEGLTFEKEELSENMLLGTRSIVETEYTVEASLLSSFRIRDNKLQPHGGDVVYYVYLSPNVEYTILTTGNFYTSSSLYKDATCTPVSGNTITVESNKYLVRNNSSFSVSYMAYEEIDDPEPENPNPEDPSGNDPSGNDPSGDVSGDDPSGNDPSGGGIELDSDLQTYLINYFGHKDYTVYESEDTFKNKKFFVSRYEYEVLKSLDDIKILLLCNVGILIVILFNGRRKRNAGT